jgi:carboxylesterase
MNKPPVQTAVLFIHGYMGNINQFEVLKPFTEQNGFAAYDMTLDGHDCTVREFYKSGRQKWIDCVTCKIDELRRRYDSIFIVGHSMGSLLALLCAVHNRDKISGILALAMPLKIRIRLRSVRISIKKMLNLRQGKDKYYQTAKRYSGIHNISAWNAVFTLPKAFDLFVLAKQARKALTALSVPMTAIFSDDDEMVRHYPKLSGNPHVKAIRLKDSGHYWFSDDDTMIIKEEILKMMKPGCA